MKRPRARFILEYGIRSPSIATFQWFYFYLWGYPRDIDQIQSKWNPRPFPSFHHNTKNPRFILHGWKPLAPHTHRSDPFALQHYSFHLSFSPPHCAWDSPLEPQHGHPVADLTHSPWHFPSFSNIIILCQIHPLTSPSHPWWPDCPSSKEVSVTKSFHSTSLSNWFWSPENVCAYGPGI